MPQRCYTDEQLKNAIIASRSYAQTLKKLGLKPAGGNYKTIQILIRELGLSTAHFYGKGWNRGEAYRAPKQPKPLNQLLIISDRPPQTYQLKRRLIREGLKKEVCEICGIVNWLDKPLALHLDHVNGNNCDNRLENLRILCPNCHAQTDTYCANNWGKYSKGA
jgi:hypothetical protein